MGFSLSRLVRNVKDTVRSGLHHASSVIDAVRDDPERLLTGGIDPLSTAATNKIFGTDYAPLTTMTGGQTEAQFQAAEAAGINTGPGRSVQSIADLAASYYGGQAAFNALSGGTTTTTGGSGGGSFTGGGGGGGAPLGSYGEAAINPATGNTFGYDAALANIGGGSFAAPAASTAATGGFWGGTGFGFNAGTVGLGLAGLDAYGSFQESKQQERLFNQAMNAGDPNSAAYKYRFNQGMQAMRRQQAATGNRLSGGATLEAIKFGQNLSSTMRAEEMRNLTGLMNYSGRASQSRQTGMATIGRGLFDFYKGGR